MSSQYKKELFTFITPANTSCHMPKLLYIMKGNNKIKTLLFAKGYKSKVIDLL